MKKKAILIGAMLLFGASVFTTANAHTINTTYNASYSGGIIWSENFDSYTANTPLGGQGEWFPWENDPSANANVTNAKSRSPTNSVEIMGTSDMVREWTNVKYGNCTFRAWAFVPEDFVGQNYLILLSLYNGGASKWNLQIYFDSDTLTLRDYDSINETPYEIGEWGEIRVEIDFVSDWQEVYYNDVLWLSKSWKEGVGGGVLELDAVDLWANGASSVYWDDMSVWATDAPIEPDLRIGDVTGGLGIKSSVKNIGAGNATNVKWTIDLDGLVFLGKSSTGSFATLAIASEEPIKSSFILGFGKTNIIISVTCDEGKTAALNKSAFVLGPFILGVK